MKPSSAAGDSDNPGVSINFDAQAFHDQDEADYAREEQQRHHEVLILTRSNISHLFLLGIILLLAIYYLNIIKLWWNTFC